MAKVDYRKYKNLITADQVVSQSMSNGNMDTSIIDDNIVLIAEITHLKQDLGDYFWGKLREKNHNDTLGTDETNFLNNYIIPCLAFYVKYEVLNDMQYNTTSSGIVTNDDDFSDPVDPFELSVLREDTFRKAEILKKDMMWWLDDDENVGVFPEYEHADNELHINGDNVTRIGGILAYGNRKLSNAKRKLNDRYYD